MRIDFAKKGSIVEPGDPASSEEALERVDAIDTLAFWPRCPISKVSVVTQRRL